MGWLKYNGYRGRNSTRNVWGVVVGVLVALVVLMVLALLLGQRYLYYGADGVHLDLPFASNEPAPPDVSQVVVEILPPAPQAPDQSEETVDGSQEEVVLPEEENSSDGETAAPAQNETE